MEIINCLCGKNEYQVLYRLPHDEILYQIVKCNNCYLVYMNPRPSMANIRKFYKKNYYYDDQNFDKINYLHAKFFYDEIEKYLVKGSIVDIGASKGFLLNFMKNKKLQLNGIEPSLSAIRFAKRNFKINIKHGYLESAKILDSSYNNVTAVDIIEHVLNPLDSLRKIYRMLKNDGVAIVETPNIQSLYCFIGKDRWSGFVLPFHLYYFSPMTLKSLFQRAGFKNIIIETSHFNILSREGFMSSKGYGTFLFIRKILKMLGKDPNKMADVINSKLSNPSQLKKNVSRWIPYDLTLLDRFEVLINKPSNYLFARKFLLGDSLRIIGYK